MNDNNQPVHDALRNAFRRVAGRTTGDDGKITEQLPRTVVHEGVKSTLRTAIGRLAEAKVTPPTAPIPEDEGRKTPGSKKRERRTVASVTEQQFRSPRLQKWLREVKQETDPA